MNFDDSRIIARQRGLKKTAEYRNVMASSAISLDIDLLGGCE
jgi:hypothetical protein